MNEFNIFSRKATAADIVVCCGDIGIVNGGTNVLQRAIESCAPGACTHLIVKLSMVTAMDPGALDVLREARTKIEALNGIFALLSPPASVTAKLKQTGEYSRYKIFNSEQEALCSFVH